MTVRETVWEELERLRAEAAAHAAHRRRRKRAALRAHRARDAEAHGVRAQAVAVLAGLPAEPAAVVARRRLVLAGVEDPSIWEDAVEVLACLPVDPDAAAHRAVLLAALAGPADGAVVGNPGSGAVENES